MGEGLSRSAARSPSRPAALLALAGLGAVLLVLSVLLAAVAGCAPGVAFDDDTPTARAAAPFEVKDWEFVAPDGAHAPVTLPAHLDDRLPAAPAEYMLRAHVPIPPEMRHGDVVVAFPGLRANAKLGADMHASIPGVRLDESMLDFYHPVHELRFRVPNEAIEGDGVLWLELRVAHRWTYSGWIDRAPLVGPADGRGGGVPQVVALDTVNRTFAVCALACGAFVALLYAFVAMGVRGAQRRAFALLAGGTAANLVYPATLLGLTQPVFGVYELAVIGPALVVGAVCAMAFTKAYFQMPAPSQWWWGWIAASIVVAILVHDPFHAVRVAAMFVLVTTMANVIVQFALALRLRRRTPRPANIYLVAFAWPATALLGAPDFVGCIGWAHPFGGVLTACAGITVVAVALGVALLRDLMRSLGRADRLNTELGSRVLLLEAKGKEIELLNDELRHQIAARSRQLVDSLVKTSEPSQELVPRRALSSGEIVEGRYKVVRLIGEGGMGAVHEVERLADGNHFAMKVLSGVSDPVQRARFAREAQIAAGVKHQHVVGLVDFDVTDDGFLYLVMELVSSETLRKVRRRATDVPWSCLVLAQVAEGLDAIHAQGIVHRDLKPANVLLQRGTDGRQPLVKITDFGVSSMIAEEMRASQRRIPSAAPAASADASAVRAASPVNRDDELSYPSIQFIVPDADSDSGDDSLATQPPTGALAALGAAAAAAAAGATGATDEDAAAEAPTRELPGARRSPVPATPSVTESAGGAKKEEKAEKELTGDETRKEPVRIPPKTAPRPGASLDVSASVPATTPPMTPASLGASGSGSGSASGSGARASHDPSLTRPGIVFGTPHYMAVELIEGKATRAADIYSFGIIAWELIAHRRPFEECALRSALKGRLYPAPPIASVVPGLHPELAAYIDRCVSHDPTHRPTARELAALFRRHAQAPMTKGTTASTGVRGGRAAGG